MDVNNVRDIFPQRLKEVMKKRNLTVSDLYRKLKRLPNGAVYRWLNGENMPSTVYLADLARVLHVSTDWLLGLTDKVMR